MGADVGYTAPATRGFLMKPTLTTPAKQSTSPTGGVFCWAKGSVNKLTYRIGVVVRSETSGCPLR